MHKILYDLTACIDHDIQGTWYAAHTGLQSPWWHSVQSEIEVSVGISCTSRYNAFPIVNSSLYLIDQTGLLLAGNRTSQALLGIQLTPADQEDFMEATKALEADFTFTTLAGEARRVFDMFIQ